MNKIDIMFIIISIVLIFSLGFFSNDLYRDLKNERTLDGLWLHNYNESEANEQAQEMDNFGEWVCVNINGMEYDRAVEVVKHEVGHEIFAEICEKDVDKCFAVVRKLKNENNNILDICGVFSRIYLKLLSKQM